MLRKRIFLFLTLAILVSALISCSSGTVADSGTARIVVENGVDDYAVYTVDLASLEKRDEGAISVLEYIASREASNLYFNIQWGGGYGAYITSIGSLSPNPSNQYIAIYTNEESDFAVPTEYSPTVATVNYGNQALTFSGVGLSSMHVKDGTVIMFRLEGF